MSDILLVGHSISAITNGSSNTSITATLPAGGANGNLLTAHLVAGDSLNPSSVIAPDGWNPLGDNFNTNGNFNAHTAIAWAIRADGLDLEWDIGASVNDDQIAIIEWSGPFDSEDPITLFTLSSGTVAQTFTSPAQTTTVDGSVFVAGVGAKNGAAASDAVVPSGMTLIYNSRSRANSAAVRSAMAYETRPTAGATGTREWSSFLSSNYYGTPFSFVINHSGVTDPEINPTGTTTSAAPGDTCTAVISNRGSLTVTGVAIYDPVSEISADQTGVSLNTETHTVTYTRTRGNLPYKSGLQLRITMSDASVLTINVEMTIEDDWQFVVLANPLADSENSVLYAYTDESSGVAEAGMQLYGPLTVPVGGGFWSITLRESGVANFQWVWEGDEEDDPGPPISVAPSLALWNGVSWVSFAPTLYNTPPDDYPDVLTFVSVFNAEYDQEYESNDVAITGINTEAEVVITGGTYRLDGGAPTDESGPAVNNQQLRLVGVAPGEDDQVTTVSGTVGSRPFTWRIYTPMTAAPTPFEPRMTVATMDVMTMDVISMEAM